MNLHRVLAGAAVLLAAALLPACKSIDVPKVPGVTPYRMVIQQGNFISQEMVSQLKPGMSKEQVRFILGTPLVTDIFHADRWDYVFFRETPDGKREQRNLSVMFEKDKLARVLGDLMPPEGAAPQASGFPTLMKPDAKPEAEAKPAAKPAAPAATPAPASTTGTAPEADRPPVAARKPESSSSASAPKSEPAPVAKEDEKKAGEEKEEPGFFGRLLERITPARAADSKADAKPAADAASAAKPAPEAPKPAVEPEKKPDPKPVAKDDESKPAEDPKERGFFDRMREKIGL